MPQRNDTVRAFITANWQTMNNKELSEALQLNRTQVRNYLNKMGLHRQEIHPPLTDAQKQERRKQQLREFRERQRTRKALEPQQPKQPRKSPSKAHLLTNNAPTEKVAKLSYAENPAKFQIRNPYDPNAPVRYERRIDPNNGRPMLVERRVS
jgi:hypothetical protein